MLQPYIKRGRIAEWYGGTADAVLQNLNVVDRGGDTVLVLAGDHIYKMDYHAVPRRPPPASAPTSRSRSAGSRSPRPRGWACSRSTSRTA